MFHIKTPQIGTFTKPRRSEFIQKRLRDRSLHKTIVTLSSACAVETRTRVPKNLYAAIQGHHLETFRH